MVVATVMAAHDPAQRTAFEQLLLHLEKNRWTNLVAAIRRILAGERDVDALCGGLDVEDSTIVDAILQGIEDPSSIEDLLPRKESAPSE